MDDDRVACRNPDCSHRILPTTAARTDGYCMPCVRAREKQEYDDYIKKNRKTVNIFEGISDPVEMLKRVHLPPANDPLIFWVPCPVATDTLYQQLTPSQASEMACHAEALFDNDEYEQAQEICLCLAAFTEANLDNCLRQWVEDEEDFDCYPAFPFHRAPADVRDTLLQRVEYDEENRSNLLCALAWIGDSAVVERFNHWRQTPPTWRHSLYIPPEDYARTAGWELTQSGGRRNLYFPQCIHLTRQPSTASRPFSTIIKQGENCPHCHLPLINLFEIAPDALGINNWPGALRMMTCECCSVYHPVYSQIDDKGKPQLRPKNPLSALAVENAKDWCPLPINGLYPAEDRLPLFAADELLPTTFSQIGGHPTWVQDAEYPQCPECSQTMTFIAQIDCHDIDTYLAGMLYGFICPSCKTTATTHQQT
ncbi:MULTISPECIES: DUF1963 domain-containing protein [unclassified Klebsiella]|uniref:DUF1963 domain-containing protein n=1 Tax=Enterobacteriaceae TaxID=543 RepID=UPI0015DC998E|nr:MULTISPECIES: DUF1963 domain-containing protein [unclassified Klebsiella]BBR59896.1 DUF1963 domain-containing protein [Klebsiella sp. WP4-W18-ESBL-05]BBS90770.1 DUF1963 domain-containing protein [Klebsiella sp. WP7-S18-CRE-02]BBS95793.1 DUF1963 domain-containing protein [Klebsiella sp. WP7-S18-CRE-03]BBT00823.1 DUF1963 domain-containing protein [Klebsiella sp. WP7-S18-ESBL-04]